MVEDSDDEVRQERGRGGGREGGRERGMEGKREGGRDGHREDRLPHAFPQTKATHPPPPHLLYSTEPCNPDAQVVEPAEPHLLNHTPSKVVEVVEDSDEEGFEPPSSTSTSSG